MTQNTNEFMRRNCQIAKRNRLQKTSPQRTEASPACEGHQPLLGWPAETAKKEAKQMRTVGLLGGMSWQRCAVSTLARLVTSCAAKRPQQHHSRAQNARASVSSEKEYSLQTPHLPSSVTTTKCWGSAPLLAILLDVGRLSVLRK